MAKAKTTKPETAKKPAGKRRPARTIEEQIADLEAKRQAQLDRRRTVLLRQHAHASEQKAALEARLENINANLRSYENELGITRDEGSETTGSETTGSEPESEPAANDGES